MRRWIDRQFELKRLNTSVGIEFRAAVTTFMAMAYILFANPEILSRAITIPTSSELLCATALCAALGSLLMGLTANYPFALAPGMGLNAYFAYTLVGSQGVPWKTALGVVFLSGLIFLFMSVSGLRRHLISTIPLSLKYATAAGIGIFLAFIGLKESGLVVAHPATLVTLGDLSQSPSQLCLLAMGAILIASVFKIRGALLLGIAAASAVAIAFDWPVYSGKAFGGFPHGFIQLPSFPTATLGAFDLKAALDVALILPILMFLFVDFFDTAGTLCGLGAQGGYLDRQGQLARGRQAYIADAIATTASGVIGSSPTTTYIESAAGIEDGGRSGLTAVFVGIFFLLAMFLWPLAAAVPAAATAAALIVVGSSMMSQSSRISWSQLQDGLPAFLTIALMPLTFSISHGIAAGIISYAVILIARRQFQRRHWLLFSLAIGISVLYALAS